jgi:hypothetical protein
MDAHPADCSAVFMHEPFWTSTTTIHGRDTSTATWMKIAYDHGVDLLLQGHNHDYERFAPQNPYTDLADPTYGMTAFVVGTGGTGHYSFSGGAAANSVVRNNTAFGILEMTLAADHMDFAFVPVAGQSFTDSGTVDCHAAPPTPPAGPFVTVTGGHVHGHGVRTLTALGVH